MKTNKLVFSLFVLSGLIISCSDNDSPTPKNDDEEVISRVILTFTPDDDSNGDVVTATWFDADGDGAGVPTIDDIELIGSVEYTLTMTLTNTLGTEDEDITAEIQDEDHEHMFFFEFTKDIFSDPTGDGNFDNRAHPLNYNDEDENGLPVGLSTSWTTGSVASGKFRVILKHQPEPNSKTKTSDSGVGGTDVDIQFDISIQ